MTALRMIGTVLSKPRLAKPSYRSFSSESKWYFTLQSVGRSNLHVASKASKEALSVEKFSSVCWNIGQCDRYMLIF